ncbi:hypothetical protein [Bradyrhizobium sp. DASA03007]|uniref:hypothetical protein n=1 Tax=unclassified Bradyrhizobium TaxID=2631580 RepID=UPI003F6EA4FB
MHDQKSDITYYLVQVDVTQASFNAHSRDGLEVSRKPHSMIALIWKVELDLASNEIGRDLDWILDVTILLLRINEA